jgi:hypothetical protein
MYIYIRVDLGAADAELVIKVDVYILSKSVGVVVAER